MSDFVVRVGPKTSPEFTTYFVGMIAGVMVEIGQIERAARYVERVDAESRALLIGKGCEVETTDVPFVERPAPKAKARRRR